MVSLANEIVTDSGFVRCQLYQAHVSLWTSVMVVMVTVLGMDGSYRMAISIDCVVVVVTLALSGDLIIGLFHNELFMLLFMSFT